MKKGISLTLAFVFAGVLVACSCTGTTDMTESIEETTNEAFETYSEITGGLGDHEEEMILNENTAGEETTKAAASSDSSSDDNGSGFGSSSSGLSGSSSSSSSSSNKNNDSGSSGASVSSDSSSSSSGSSSSSSGSSSSNKGSSSSSSSSGSSTSTTSSAKTTTTETTTSHIHSWAATSTSEKWVETAAAYDEEVQLETYTVYMECSDCGYLVLATDDQTETLKMVAHEDETGHDGWRSTRVYDTTTVHHDAEGYTEVTTTYTCSCGQTKTETTTK